MSEIVKEMVLKTIAAQEAELEEAFHRLDNLKDQVTIANTEAYDLKTRVLQLRDFAAQHGWLP